MKMKQGIIKKGLILGVFLLLMAIVIVSSTPKTSASSENPYLWPYNQSTNITFNEADVYDAWTAWRDAQITTTNAGGNGRYRVMGGVDGGSTVSEGQAYGMLYTSIFDEQTMFDGLYLFAKDHFNSQGVMDWYIGDPGVRLGSGGATDGEVDMAIALVNACVKVQQNAWPTSPAGIDYCVEATNLINAIYTYEVDHVGSSPPGGLPNNQVGNELLPGDTWDVAGTYPDGIINLSYFPPGYFTVFGKFTNNEAAWNAVIDRNYEMTDLVQAKPDNCSGLVPNWNNYDGDAQLVSWQTNNYSWWSYDAARFAWRIAVDQAWYGRPEAAETMNKIGGFFSATGLNNIGEHSMDGIKRGGGAYPFFVANAASAVWAAPNATAVNCGTASGSLQETAQSAYNKVLTTKDNPNSYYGNAWRLFSMLLMTGNFPNFYEMVDGGVTPVPTDTPGGPTNTPTNTPTATATTPVGTDACSVDYAVAGSWNGGFQIDVTLTNNTSSTVNGYDLTWTHTSGQVVDSGWNVTINQTGNAVTASNPAGYWNGVLSPNGGTSSFGFQGSLSGSSVVIPTDFALNGVACNGDVAPTETPTASVTPTETPDITVTPTATTCPMATPELFVVEPVTSPTNDMSQTLLVRLSNGEWVRATGPGGTVTVDTPDTDGYYRVTVPLAANSNNVIEVEGKVRSTSSGGCSYGGYTLSENVTIVQESGVTPTHTPTATATTPPSSSYCSVDYVVGNDWGSGFTTDITITNTGSSTINGWTLTYTFSGNQTITNAWNATASQSGSNVTVTDTGWNGTLAPNSSASFGFQGSYSGSNIAPSEFMLNGTLCQ